MLCSRVWLAGAHRKEPPHPDNLVSQSESVSCSPKAAGPIRRRVLNWVTRTPEFSCCCGFWLFSTGIVVTDSCLSLTRHQLASLSLVHSPLTRTTSRRLLLGVTHSTCSSLTNTRSLIQREKMYVSTKLTIAMKPHCAFSLCPYFPARKRKKEKEKKKENKHRSVPVSASRSVQIALEK